MKKLFYENNGSRTLSADHKYEIGTLLTIIVSCIITAVLQGGRFFYSTHYTKVLLLACLFLFYTGLSAWLKISKRLTENTGIYMMILLGVLLRCGYVLLSGLYERQHDAGVYTGIGTSFINPGHIGYIEYIYKFHKLPDINPYELFAYYHPPLHHILSFLWLKVNILFGASEELAFENLQILPLLYSCLCMFTTWQTLKLLEIKRTGLLIGLAFMVFHPAAIIMAGSVNNDMLTILFMCLIIYGSLKWILEKNLKHLIFLAFTIGLGMITKLNSAVLAIPLALVFLIHFISVIRTKKKGMILTWVKNYCIFALIVIPIGLSWILRNLIRFGEKPGVPVPGETSPMYTADFSLWQRLGIPSLADLHLDFPFHPISAKACANTWAIMFHTSLFTEEYPADLPDVLLALCQITFILSLLLGIATAILLVCVLLDKRTNFQIRIFLLTGYFIMLVSFAAFVIIYPYTCSSDFRYVAITLVYISIALGLGNRYYLQLPPGSSGFFPTKAAPVFMHMVNCGILAVLILIQVIYVFWGRW